MEFLSIRDKLDEFRFSYGTKSRLISGVKIFGTVVANTVIAATKVPAKVAEHIEAKQKQLK